MVVVVEVESRESLDAELAVLLRQLPSNRSLVRDDRCFAVLELVEDGAWEARSGWRDDPLDALREAARVPVSWQARHLQAPFVGRRCPLCGREEGRLGQSIFDALGVCVACTLPCAACDQLPSRQAVCRECQGTGRQPYPRALGTAVARLRGARDRADAMHGLRRLERVTRRYPLIPNDRALADLFELLKVEELNEQTLVLVSDMLSRLPGGLAPVVTTADPGALAGQERRSASQ